MKAAVKNEITFAILCVICTAVFFVSAAVSANISRGMEEPEKLARLTESEVEESGASEEFILMEHDGHVYVYSAGEPFILTDIDPERLPLADREKLREGIGAADRETLLGLIEDFGS